MFDILMDEIWRFVSYDGLLLSFHNNFSNRVSKGRDVPGQTGTGRPVVPLSRDNEGTSVPVSLCPGTKKFCLSRCPEKLHCPVPLETLVWSNLRSQPEVGPGKAKFLPRLLCWEKSSLPFSKVLTTQADIKDVMWDRIFVLHQINSDCISSSVSGPCFS